MGPAKKTWQLQLCLLDSELNQSQLNQGRVSDAIQELEQKNSAASVLTDESNF